MRFAPIAPSHLLHNVSVFASRIHYHMALGQELVRDNQYSELYRRLARLGNFIIVDNGAAEPEEERVPFEEIVRVALAINADEIVLPDVVRDAGETIKALEANRDLIEKIPARKRVFIPQGQNINQWFECFDYVTNIMRLDYATIGIPKHLERWPNGRIQALDAVKDWHRYHIHFFGIYNNPKEEILQAARYPKRVRSIDSGAPFAYAQNNQVIDEVPRHSLSWTASAPSALVEANLRMILQWCEMT